ANLAMVALGAVLNRLLLPLGAVGAALWAEQQGLGMLRWLGLDGGWGALIAILLLDLGIYSQHVAFHRIGWLWRIHRMHHADPDLDTTTGVRFHPLEYLLSMAWKIVLVVAIGADAAAVIIFEILLNALALFNHADWRLPVGLDRLLRLVIVTPDVHAVHHSVRPDEHHRNFGFNLTAWDRLFGTWRARPAKGVAQLDIGLADVPASRALSLAALLLMPLQRPAGD
ncbi:MAG: sterol desaturase family protein, partial [Alphaproteobacteria bacterium]